jgi:hypothetical protein
VIATKLPAITAMAVLAVTFVIPQA